MQELIYLGLTIIVYLFSKAIYRKFNYVLLSPLILTPLVLIALLVLLRVPYPQYATSTQPITKFLEPATIAFAVPLYKYYDVLKKNILTIVSSVLAGSVIAIISSIMLAYYLHLSSEALKSMAPRSVTTPIAMQISTAIGGIPSMTAVFVLITGLSGTVIGPLTIRLFRLRSPISKGVLLGMGAHACGTAKAREFGAIEGTMASLAMIIAGLFTVLLQPFILFLFNLF